jgi:N,N'-diacetyllegionaminate synthase
MLSQKGIFIVAELAQTHEGSLELARLLVKASAAAGADAAKVQVFKAEEICTPRYKHYKLFKQLEWPDAWWKALIDCAHQCSIQLFADVFGIESLEMLIGNGIDGLKIHGTDMKNLPLLKRLAEVDLPLLLSIGGGTVEESRTALNILRSGSRGAPVVLMHGFQSYPTLTEHTHLNKMGYFRDQLRVPVGFADHIDGDHRLNFALCAAAVGMGAVIIEKHITVSRSLKMEDYESALNPDEFGLFVLKMREMESALGSYSEEMTIPEEFYRKDTRKHVVAASALKPGHVIGEGDVRLKRTDSLEEASLMEDVIGRRCTKDYLEDDVIFVKDLS